MAIQTLDLTDTLVVDESFIEPGRVLFDLTDDVVATEDLTIAQVLACADSLSLVEALDNAKNLILSDTLTPTENTTFGKQNDYVDNLTLLQVFCLNLDYARSYSDVISFVEHLTFGLATTTPPASSLVKQPNITFHVNYNKSYVDKLQLREQFEISGGVVISGNCTIQS